MSKRTNLIWQVLQQHAIKQQMELQVYLKIRWLGDYKTEVDKFGKLKILTLDLDKLSKVN